MLSLGSLEHLLNKFPFTVSLVLTWPPKSSSGNAKLILLFIASWIELRHPSLACGSLILWLLPPLSHFLNSLPCSRQMRYGLNHSPQCVYLSWFWALHLLFPRWGVYFYPLTVGPVSSPLSFKASSDVTSGSILPSSSQLLLKCLCLYFSFYSLCSVVVYLNTLALLELSFTQVCMSCQSAKSSSLLAIE